MLEAIEEKVKKLEEVMDIAREECDFEQYEAALEEWKELYGQIN